MRITKGLSKPLLEKYEFFDYGHALEIITKSCSQEWDEIKECLRLFEFKKSDITAAGGNKSPIPKIFDSLLFPKEWKEVRITADLFDPSKKYKRTSSSAA